MKKKLLIAAHHLTVGGVQKTLVAALKAIDYEKFDVTLYLRKNRTDLLQYIDPRVHTVINKDPNHYYRKPFALALQACAAAKKLAGKSAADTEKKLADEIRRRSMEYEQKTYFEGKHYDIAIAYVQGYTALFVAQYVNADKKFVFYHTSTDDMHALHEELLPNFNKIVALHSEQKTLIESWYPDQALKTVIVENYTDRELIKNQSLEFSVHKPLKKTVFCSCGRFAPVKGFDLAVKAAKILKDKGFNFLWYFVGDGPERADIEKLIAENELENEIIITGMQKNPYPYIAACDIFVQPSYEESLGLTILEAHRLGKAVVATETVGGSKLIVNGENGILCKINSDDIAKAAEKLVTDTALRQKIEANLKSTDYSEEFEKYKSQWKSLLEE